MVVNLNTKDIKFNSVDSIKLLNKGIISRSQARTADEFIVLPKTTILMSKKINNLVDIWVSANDDWKFVKHGDTEELERLFEACEEKETTPVDAVEESKEVLPVDESVEEAEPVVENSEGIALVDIKKAEEEAIEEAEVEETQDEVVEEATEEKEVEAEVEEATEEEVVVDEVIEEPQAKPSDPTVIPVKAPTMNEQFKVKKKYNNNKHN